MLGAFRDQHIKPVLIVRQGHAADMVQTARHAGNRLKLAVEFDCIALEGCHIRVAVQRMEPTRRVPSRTAGQFRTLQEHHIGPAEFCQVIQHGTADNAAADNDTSCRSFHVAASPNTFPHYACQIIAGGADSDTRCRLGAIVSCKHC